MRRSVWGACVAILLLCSWAARPATAAPEDSDSETAVREAVSRFRAAVGEGTYEAIIPTVASADAREIRERLAAKLSLFRVEDLARFFAMAVSRAKRDAAEPAPDTGPEFSVTLTEPEHARLDIEPLLSFRPSVYMLREDGAWKVDLTLTLQRSSGPRPKEEIVSICRRALRGIADDADLVETKHFLIFAHTGPLPAQSAAQLLEELYDNFQQVFPFDLGIQPRAQPASADAGNPAPADAVEPPLPFSPGPDPYMIVFLFSYHQTYLKFAERHDPAALKSGGYATPAGYFAVWFSPTFRPTVRHEGTHLLMFRRMHLFGAPSWLAEGMAENMADPRDAADADRPLRERLLNVVPISLEPLLMSEKIAFGLDYLLSQSLVHFLRTEHPKEWVELVAFIRNSPRPRPKECHAELLRLLGMTQSQLDAAWTKSVLDSAGSVPVRAYEAAPGGATTSETK
ncbi:MAG: hypothetical protein ABSA67_03250 [Candidatus Brocadiia bacterium]|jgi:hypothetical protein